MLSPTSIGAVARSTWTVSNWLSARASAPSHVEEHQRGAGHSGQHCAEQEKLPMDHGRQTFPRSDRVRTRARSSKWATAEAVNPRPRRG